MKLTKEHLDKVRDIEGFPIGKDEDIIALSHPPYYTACPNPFINDFIKEHGKPYDEETDDYKREPFAADVSEGKNDPIYNAHSYHTKVPHKAIMRYILHYTEPGDIVFDGFCGTGMTGVAAQMCGNPNADKEFKFTIEKEMPNVKWGTRKAILNDLSPAATFIAYNYNTPVDVVEFEKEANKILDECEKELGWMYETNHVDENGKQIFDITGSPIKGKINYTIWSDVFICPNCGNEIIFWDAAVDEESRKVKDVFECNNCGLETKKRGLERASELVHSEGTNIDRIVKQLPVLISYSINKKRYEKIPDLEDVQLINKIRALKLPSFYHDSKIEQGDKTKEVLNRGVLYSSDFYTSRNIFSILKIIEQIRHNINHPLMFALSALNRTLSKLEIYRPEKRSAAKGTFNHLYFPSLSYEGNVFVEVENKLKAIFKAYAYYKDSEKNVSICTQSSTNLSNIRRDSIDYIFTDPPFGDNIMYSELNFLRESFLKVFSNNENEAIINKTQEKGIIDYQLLMEHTFKEFYRILKPNRWITIEFHNSKNLVWNAIQEALIKVGFIVADIRILDKKQGSYNQNTANSAVKNDLVISAYKPKESFKQRFIEKAGTEETVLDFVREHLDKLPVVVKKGNVIEKVKEREAFLLFDRMVAYHIISGIAVPIDASDFYKGLYDKFIERDDMYFLHDQINEYDSARITSELEDVQFSMFVNDEKSAIAWLYYQLEEPQNYSNIMPKFMKEANAAKYEKMPELSELLEENFLQDEEGKWYIPDPSKSGDIIKLREKRLLKEFDEYLSGKGKLKQFRTEAVRAGFAKLWKNKDYENIVMVGNRLPEIVIQEDDKLLMYYDIALSRVE